MKKAGIAVAVIAALALALMIWKPMTRYQLAMMIAPDQKIWVTEKVPLQADIDSPVTIRILDPLYTMIKVLDPLKIRLNESFDVPLIMNLLVPLNTEFYMNDTLDLAFDLPVDILLTQAEMPLNGLVVPFNQRLFIDDSLAVDFSIPMDSKVRTALRDKGKGIGVFINGEIPVKATIPIHQYLTVKDTIIINAQDYKVPLKTIIPVKAQVPIRQWVRVSGEITVPVNQTVSIPLSKVVTTPVLENFRAEVVTQKPVRTGFESGLNATSSFSKPLTVTMEQLELDPSSIKIISVGKKEEK